jgi:hypothetical protein
MDMAVARYTCDEMLNSSTFMARRHGMTSGHELVNCFHGGDTTNDAGHRLVLYCTSLLEYASDGASSRFKAGVASLQACRRKVGLRGLANYHLQPCAQFVDASLSQKASPPLHPHPRRVCIVKAAPPSSLSRANHSLAYSRCSSIGTTRPPKRTMPHLHAEDPVRIAPSLQTALNPQICIPQRACNHDQED